MAWDAARPVPWQRLMREWLVYVAIMAVLFVVFFRDRGLLGIFSGLLASGPLYLGFGYVRTKLGFDRKSLGELRQQTRDERRARDDQTAVDAPRPKPPPTRRTGGGSTRPGGRRRR